MAFDLTLTLALLAANAFFVATEFAITRLRPTQVDEFERRSKPGSRSVRHAVEHIDAYLAACQLGITISSLGLGVVGETFFHDLLEPVIGEGTRVFSVGLAGAVAFGILTLLHVVVGELAPKSVAISRTTATSLAVAAPMRVFYMVTKPVVDLFNGMGNLLLKPFGIPPAREAGHVAHSEDELRSLLAQSSDSGYIDPYERRLTENVFTFGDRRIREVMVPRPEVHYVSAEDEPADVARRSIETGFTRFPVCEPDGGLDAATGMVHVKDLMPVVLDGGDTPLRELVRPLSRVADSTRVDEVLRDLRQRRHHQALVTDEHGTAVGLVTLEDLLEEIVGEIEDEFDPAAGELIQRRDGHAIVPGSASVAAVEEQLSIEISDRHEATIGGHVLETLGRLPEVGEAVEIGGRRFEVSSVHDTRVAELRVPLAEEEQTGGAADPDEG